MQLEIVKMALPESIGGLYSLENDKATIVINKNKSELEQEEAFLHECLHLWNNDFDSNSSVDQIEERTHQQLRQVAKSVLGQ